MKSLLWAFIGTSLLLTAIAGTLPQLEAIPVPPLLKCNCGVLSLAHNVGGISAFCKLSCRCALWYFTPEFVLLKSLCIVPFIASLPPLQTSIFCKSPCRSASTTLQGFSLHNRLATFTPVIWLLPRVICTNVHLLECFQSLHSNIYRPCGMMSQCNLIYSSIWECLSLIRDWECCWHTFFWNTIKRYNCSLL